MVLQWQSHNHGSPLCCLCRCPAMTPECNFSLIQLRGSNNSPPCPQLPEQELLCQAEVALAKVTRCKDTYEPLISNLKLLRGKKSCVLSDDNEIYLRHFLPALGNFTQGLFRRRGWAAL
uniref:Uncharacterized protein n=1 Tax=Geospiza parvula TaxID=87175 RepID=A0A8C3MUT4_GEOPR